MKVLVVDDIGYTCHFYAGLIESGGHEVLTAQSGAEALRVLQGDSSVDIVLTDLKMRDMDGVDFYLAALRLDWNSNQERPIPPGFVLMTASLPEKDIDPGDARRIEQARELGFHRVLFKPLRKAELLRSLDEISREARESNSFDFTREIAWVKKKIDQLLSLGNMELAKEFSEQVERELRRVNELIFASDALE